MSDWVVLPPCLHPTSVLPAIPCPEYYNTYYNIFGPDPCPPSLLRPLYPRSDQVVFGGQGFSLTRAQLQLAEAWGKVGEGVTFMVRGIKLLGSDVGNSGRLFWKAAMGESGWAGAGFTGVE